MATRPCLQFLPPTRKTVDDLSDLAVREDERHLIAPNPDWLAQAPHFDGAVTYGIYIDSRAAGLISLIDPRLVDDKEDLEHLQKDCLYVWRVMVDKDHRGKGCSAGALDFARRYAALVGLAGVSLITMDRERGNALAFYEGLGFVPTGRRLNGEIELVLRAN